MNMCRQWYVCKRVAYVIVAILKSVFTCCMIWCTCGMIFIMIIFSLGDIREQKVDEGKLHILVQSYSFH